MKVRNYYYLLVIMPVVLSGQEAFALQDGDSLQFGSGSYFAMEVAPGFFLRTNIESHEGIILGQEQPASGSHSGVPDGSELNTIDVPWLFFGNTGMHQTIVGSGGVTIVSDDNNGNFELDFSGLGVTWNGIPNINMGGNGTPSNTGLASMSCSTIECEIGDQFTLDYFATVPIGDPSGFGGVNYYLHLEGRINIAPDIVNITILTPGGRIQECSTIGGSIVEFSSRIRVPSGDEVENITWIINGEIAGNTESISHFLALGENTVTVMMTTTSGLSANNSTTLRIVDTTRPEVIAEFVTQAGEVVTEIDKSRRITIRTGAVDICDPDPVVTDSYLKKNEVVSVNNGDSFTALPNGKTNILQFQENLRLNVSARDASGNSIIGSSILNINDY